MGAENVSVSVLSKVLSFDYLSCPPIWNNYRKRIKDKEKEKVGQEASNLKAREKELERERKNKGDISFCWRNNVKF